MLIPHAVAITEQWLHVIVLYFCSDSTEIYLEEYLLCSRKIFETHRNDSLYLLCIQCFEVLNPASLNCKINCSVSLYNSVKLIAVSLYNSVCACAEILQQKLYKSANWSYFFPTVRMLCTRSIVTAHSKTELRLLFKYLRSIETISLEHTIVLAFWLVWLESVSQSLRLQAFRISFSTPKILKYPMIFNFWLQGWCNKVKISVSGQLTLTICCGQQYFCWKWLSGSLVSLAWSLCQRNTSGSFLSVCVQRMRFVDLSLAPVIVS